MKHDKDIASQMWAKQDAVANRDSIVATTLPGWNSDEKPDPERKKAALEILRQRLAESAVKPDYEDHQYWKDAAKRLRELDGDPEMLARIKEAFDKMHRDWIMKGTGTVDTRKFNDRLPSGEPCTTDEVAGLGWFNLGRLDPIRKPAVFHDRLYDGIIAGTSDITQDEADKLYLKAMLAEADHHQLGYARSIFRYGIVRLVSLFRRVGK